jgi:pimeloyl-ACP methyl ester carboxylesterase
LAASRAPAEEILENRVLAAARTVVAEAADHSLRYWLRDRLWDDDDAARYGLRLDDNWQEAADKAPNLPLVVLIHGFNSTPARNAAILAPIRGAGFPSAVFTYPNDSDISESAACLSRALKGFAAAHPERRVALVTHSMGGLVARAAVEDAKLDPGNVTRLVMIAPPTHGSMFAHVSFGTDLWEHWLTRRDGSPWRRWRDSVVDGLGEASDELVPGSPFLTQLNSQPRNPRIRYAIFLGTQAALSERDFKVVRWMLGKTMRVEHVGRYAESVDKVVEDMDELVDGKGDGVVALKRGRLEGVDDVVLLPFDHFSCTDEPGDRDDDAVRQLQTELLARLR